MLKESAQRLDPSRRKGRPKLRQFVADAWHIVEPGMPFRPNWHADAIADHLEAVTAGDLRELVINIPPGHAKSILVGVLWPAWIWIDWPEWRGLFSSYDLSLVTRDAVRSRDVMESEWYRSEFAPLWRFKTDQNVKTFFKNTRQGFRFCHTVAGKGTGHRGDGIVVDDPLNAKDRHSAIRKLASIDWWRRTMPTRLNDPAVGFKVVVMQRLAEDDLTGDMLAEGGAEHLCLPSLFEPERRSRTFVIDKGSGEKRLFFEDPRTESGELLFPGLFTAPVLEDLRKKLGETDFAAQHQQRPAPADGAIFKTAWWRFWVPPGRELPPVRLRLADGSWHECPTVELPEAFDEQIQSWDLAFKDTKESDYVAGGVWAKKGADKFLLDLIHDRLDFVATCKAFRVLTARNPAARAKLVEDKANGPAVIAALRSEIPGLIAVSPMGDKVARARACTPDYEAGNVYLPHPQVAAGLGFDIFAYLAEHNAFPNGAHDDRVDQGTQALARFVSGGKIEVVRAGRRR